MCSYLSSLGMAKLNDGNTIPWIGFGTYLCSEEEVFTSCQSALECGYEHIDTAEGYGTEHIVGNVLKINPKIPFITTKLWPLRENGTPKSYQEVLSSCESSLSKLGLPSIDLYLIHAPFGNSISRVQQWKALLHLQEIGKCKSIGVSNYSSHHLEEIRLENLPMPVINQLELHPLCQHREIVEYCRGKNILPVAYSSLAPLSDWRPGQRSAKLHQPVDSSLEQITDIFQILANKYHISPGQLLLKWGIQSGYPVLPKSIHLDRILSNFDLQNEIVISDSDMQMLNDLNQEKAFAWPSGDPCLTP
jgi:2,5-diketo-D-gluconate reductase A